MRHAIRILLVLAAGWCCCLTPRQASAVAAPTTRPFILGADITWVAEDEAAGAEYYDAGVRKDLFVLLHDHGFNYVRLRVFVNPKAPRGYAARSRNGEAFGDLAHALVLAKRAKVLGMGVLIDLHFSDTWASPGHQAKPAAWEALSFDELVAAAKQHTHDVVAALVAQGTPPDMIQLGNEITDGMLFPDGHVRSLVPANGRATGPATRPDGDLGNYDQLATILKACAAEVRRLSPATKIALHHHLGRSSERVQEWLDNLLARGVDLDVVGLSCYAQAAEGDWQRTFTDLYHKYPKLGIVAMEYSARKRYLNDLVHDIPDGRGLGTFIWEPTRHREALFDKDGRNAGGGQASNFVNDLGTDQGAAPAAPTTRRAATQPRTHGGRYDANAWLQVYDQIRHDYGL